MKPKLRSSISQTRLPARVSADLTWMRNLDCCGDPLRRLVAKCFCLGGKDEPSRGLPWRAHSLLDVLERSRDSDMALLKIDFIWSATPSSAVANSAEKRAE